VQVAIRSRLGRSVLTALGILYFVAAFTILVYYVISNWGANRLTDYVLQLALIASALGGVFFVLIGTRNFSAWRSGARTRPTTEHRNRKTATAA